jgi:hypothetical protein
MRLKVISTMELASITEEKVIAQNIKILYLDDVGRVRYEDTA